MAAIERDSVSAGHMSDYSSGTGILSILDYSDNRIQVCMMRDNSSVELLTGICSRNREGHVESSSAKCRCEAETQSVHSENLGSLSLEAGDAGSTATHSTARTQRIYAKHRKGRCW